MKYKVLENKSNYNYYVNNHVVPFHGLHFNKILCNITFIYRLVVNYIKTL